MFRRSIAAKADLPNSHFGLALVQQRTEAPAVAIGTLEGLFNGAKAQDARSRGVFEQARELYAELQESEATRQRANALKAVQELQVQVEQESGFPVRVVEGEFKDTTGANIQMA